MSKFSKRMRFTYFAVLLTFLLIQNSFGQILNKDILNEPINLNLEGESLFQICASLVYFEKIPIGLEGAVDFNFDGKEKIQIKSGTLREVLDSIVKQEPNYKWELRDGVVNIYPIHLRDEFIKTLLETKIKSFSSRKQMGRKEIRDNIYDLDVIKSVLSSKQTRLGIAVATELYVKDATTDIDISDTDLRGLLNKVIYESGDSKSWTISRSADDSIFLSF